MLVALALLFSCSAPPPAPAPAPVKPIPAPPVEAPSPGPAFDLSACSQPLPLEWFPLGEGTGGLKFAAAFVPDLDGDGKPERFTVQQDAGVGFATVQLRLEPTQGDPVAMEQIFSYTTMRAEIPVPAALQGPERAAWRAPFEQELLRLRCPAPDPSLAWLLDPSPRWTQGPPLIPPFYGTYDPANERWWAYSSHTHTMDPPAIGQWPVEDAVRGAEHLLRTQHGVILYDTDRDAHRWLFVSETGTGKLRFPTVALVDFDGDGVIVERHAQGQDPPPAVRVDLATGAVTVVQPAEPDPSR